MKLLIISQYFWPESFIINDIVRKLVEQGHEITVATGKPNYPDGDIFIGYRALGVQHEKYLDEVDVFRVPIWPRGRGRAWSLTLNYLSFVLSGLFFFPWLLRKHAFDAILVFAPSPITQVIPAIPLKWRKNAHLALWIQDLWPESLKAMGVIKHPYLLKAAGFFVRMIYSGCDTLLVQSRAFIGPVSRFAALEKIVYYPNSMSAQVAATSQIPVELTSELKENFSVVFAGNLGMAQALDTIVSAAIHLKDEPGIRLVIVGTGSQFDWLKEQKQTHLLDNLLLPGRFPMDAMPAIFEHASTLLVSLRDEEIFAQTVPSKIQAYLAAGRPIIASLRGEGATVLEESGAGVICPPENAKALAEAILYVKGLDEKKRKEMGDAGGVYFEKHFNMASQVNRLVDIFKEKLSA